MRCAFAPFFRAQPIKSVYCGSISINSKRVYKTHLFLIGVEGGDSSGKSVSRWDPAGAQLTRRLTDRPRKASAWNENQHSLSDRYIH